MKFTLTTEVRGEQVTVTWSNDEADLQAALPFALDAPAWVGYRLMRRLILDRPVPVGVGTRMIPPGLEQPFEAYHTIMAVLRDATTSMIDFVGDDDGTPLNYMPEPGVPASTDP